MQERSRLINRLALVLLSIVVLELVLIGDQVQPVKAIKKKIFLKKLKKVLPLLALVKPKKKIILVPIPIPMFNKPNQRNPYGQPNGMRPVTMITDGLQPPNSFTMIGAEPGLVGVGPPPHPMQMQMEMGAPAGMSMSSSNLPEAGFEDTMVPMMQVPSMTMTIQSDASGGSNIELSMQNASSPASLIRQPQHQQQQSPTKWTNHLQQQQFDHFDEPEQPGGEHYYSSPWLTGRPLTSPAKLLRNERLRKQQQQQVHRPPPVQQTVALVSAPTQRPHQPAAPTSGRLQQQPRQQQQQQPLMPVLVIKNQWHPTSTSTTTGSLKQQEPARTGRKVAAHVAGHHVRPLNSQDPFQRQIQQQISQALEVEELVPVGPAQLMPIYQTPNGKLHISPPTSRPAQQQQVDKQQQQQQQMAQVTVDQSSFEHEEEQKPASNQSNSGDAEVQTVSSVSGNLGELAATVPPAAGGQSTDSQQPPVEVVTSPRPSSPASKAKQQQQQLASKRAKSSSGGY